MFCPVIEKSIPDECDVEGIEADPASVFPGEIPRYAIIDDPCVPAIGEVQTATIAK